MSRNRAFVSRSMPTALEAHGYRPIPLSSSVSGCGAAL
ncbi:putative lipoprotein [Slackia sp. CM382]|nr:putative lipoprotein [Slackia sp. CM382]